jgi:ring-1,2-phenylacetyl-CoA epoxidase subunit PaaD
MMTTANIYDILETVTDPEVPVLTILDLGIVRDVQIIDDTTVHVTITPTYSGCPAMNTISIQIRLALMQEGFRNIHIHTVLTPAWTTDWMTPAGKDKLKAYGIAPPQYAAKPRTGLFDEPMVQCPQCNSFNTRLISEFGSTSCKALYQCNDCKEPFDYFKCH